MKYRYLFLLGLFVPLIVSYSYRGLERAPAGVVQDPSVLWQDLASATRDFREELLQRTLDIRTPGVSESETRPAVGPRASAIVDLRFEVEYLLRETRHVAKKREAMSGAELDRFFELYARRLKEWAGQPLMREFPGTIEQRLQRMRDRYLGVLRQERPEAPADPGLEALFPARAKEIVFKSANHVCAMVARPGDIILRKALLSDGGTEDDFSPRVMKVIQTLEKLKGGDEALRYRHSELISRIEGPNNIESISYYPWYFMMTKPEPERKPMFLVMNKANPEYFTYRSKYSAFRVKSSRHEIDLFTREGALDRLDSRVLYHRMGTCADFVSWAFHNTITSPWNQVPGVKLLIQLIYPPEAIQTPNDLADSSDTEKICEVDNSGLLFPRKIDARDWVNRARTDLGSSREPIREHAGNVWRFLVEQGVITPEGERLVESVDVKLKTYQPNY